MRSGLTCCLVAGLAVAGSSGAHASETERGAELYAAAAREARSTAERDHLTREAARLRA